MVRTPTFAWIVLRSPSSARPPHPPAHCAVMVLHAAASLASAVLPAGALGFVTDHPRFESAAARLGVRADSPLAVLLATALLVFPAAVAMSASRAVGARGRRERQRANDENIKVVLVTGASGGLGALIVDRLREAFPNAAVYGTSRSGWSPRARFSLRGRDERPSGRFTRDERTLANEPPDAVTATGHHRRRLGSKSDGFHRKHARSSGSSREQAGSVSRRTRRRRPTRRARSVRDQLLRRRARRATRDARDASRTQTESCAKPEKKVARL